MRNLRTYNLDEESMKRVKGGTSEFNCPICFDKLSVGDTILETYCDVEVMIFDVPDKEEKSMKV